MPEMPLSAKSGVSRGRPSCQSVCAIRWGLAAAVRHFGDAWQWCDSADVCERVGECLREHERARAVLRAYAHLDAMREWGHVWLPPRDDI